MGRLGSLGGHHQVAKCNELTLVIGHLDTDR